MHTWRFLHKPVGVFHKRHSSTCIESIQDTPWHTLAQKRKYFDKSNAIFQIATLPCHFQILCDICCVELIAQEFADSPRVCYLITSCICEWFGRLVVDESNMLSPSVASMHVSSNFFTSCEQNCRTCGLYIYIYIYIYTYIHTHTFVCHAFIYI